ncbi:uncharacterized protein NECHADRAFT_77121 [Fusarium vanettenii 77-13-4]|uniref:MYND-type domain-containing protein n=1 Tax=Fusarium vanettenii (strain ATCC MYA-4622 / CBS 123669 / FGSC 9596 / NRRL 45880 / 77-13-4) TaxID=660122 RepID=C7ZCP3_FUSV7|nr:uncharacterized protein NECHADRAFT_77121 [Fusarium vanettenii 77-13-4]EEU38297.1 hypothetical protein NECHADRAFT_77121 [Fusarium vanettenii 77-13-4]
MASASNDASRFKGPVGPLRHRCPQCTATGPELLRCSACRGVRYCSREHQAADRSQHKSACNKIKKARVNVSREEDLVRNGTGFLEPANAFETHVGRFYGLMNTRDYMSHRLFLANRLCELSTLDGVHEALEHMRDMLRLNRSDNIGLRDLVPAMMLRLDLDQECYDFVKWWATCDSHEDYDWEDMTLPHLDIHGADVFEYPDFLERHPALNHIIAILLLKLKLLVDIRNLKMTRKILALRRVPHDLWQSIELSVIRSPLSLKLQRDSPEALIQTEANLLFQTRQRGYILPEANYSFMYYFFDPDEALCARPEGYSRGSWEEMALAMQYSYAAWWETEGIMDLLNEARACAARSSGRDVETMVARSSDSREAEELLADLNVKQIWHHLDEAFKNASYLGPWSERPSERHIRQREEVWARYMPENITFIAG